MVSQPYGVLFSLFFSLVNQPYGIHIKLSGPNVA